MAGYGHFVKDDLHFGCWVAINVLNVAFIEIVIRQNVILLPCQNLTLDDKDCDLAENLIPSCNHANIVVVVSNS